MLLITRKLLYNKVKLKYKGSGNLSNKLFFPRNLMLYFSRE